MPVYLLPMAAGFALLVAVETTVGATVTMARMAITHGAAFALLAAFWAEFYGTRHIGAIRAIATAVMVSGSAVGPAVSGALIDRGLSFPVQGPLIAASFLVAAALAATRIWVYRDRLSAARRPAEVEPAGRA